MSLEKKVAKAVEVAVSSPHVNADQTSIAPITAAVMEEVQPRIDQLTGMTPIWQSQTFWGLAVLIVTRELALRGHNIPQEYHGPILDLTITYGPYLAALVIGYGRWFAKKPLFSGWFKGRTA